MLEQFKEKQLALAEVLMGRCRRVKDADTQEDKGVAGSLDSLSEHRCSEQPVSGFDWNPGKTGLFCCTALDQTLGIGLVTKLHLV